MEFLRLNRATIVDAPPFSDDWTGVDGAWARRYLQEVSEINPKLRNSEKGKVIFTQFNQRKGLHIRSLPELWSIRYLPVPSVGGGSFRSVIYRI